ncbi:hypothetical protein INT47_009207 [Mucor saturninus]|uniref:Uncharacterized protein n=1 Tax=Mucor saturninus TaxID=64648 RepID=A0A8H7VEH8_9FUNG|nr:hypothetical protein INT47_009207 [Mucor saturninus]
MLKLVQIVILLLIIASLILQILVIFGNYSGLRKLNIIRVELTRPASSSTGGLFGGFLDTVDKSVPDYLTVGLFVLCEGNNGTEDVCTPPTFGFRYSSTGILNTIQEQIPEYVHSTLSGIQKGVFIVSAAICFLLLCYSFYDLLTGSKRGCCRTFSLFTIATLALLFCIATFVVQIVAFNLVKSGITKAKDDLFGGLVDNLVTITTKRGASAWLSLAGFISLFLVCILSILSVCCLKPKAARRNEENYEMGPVAH